MTDFSIEDEKDAIKTKPSYPGCCCEQQASLHSPSIKQIHNSQEVEGMWTPVEECYHQASVERWAQGKEGVQICSGGAAGLPLCPPFLHQRPLCPLRGALHLVSATTHWPRMIAGRMHTLGATDSVPGCCTRKTVHSLCTISDSSWGELDLSLPFRCNLHKCQLPPVVLKQLLYRVRSQQFGVAEINQKAN